METINKKILIVEDNADFRGILQQAFSDAGFNVVAASDGQEGLDMAVKENPDLIMMDVLMPRLNGIDSAKKIKEAGVKSHIIFLTNVNEEESISRAIEITQSDYLIKSDLHVDKIVERVKEKLGVKK